jgi:hypothetical protein
MDEVNIPMPEAASQVPVASEQPPVPASPPETPAPEPTKAESAEPPKPEGSDEGEEAPKKARQPASERISQLYAQKKAAEADAFLARQEAQRYYDELRKLRETPVDQLPYEQQEAARLKQVVKEHTAEEKVAQAQMAAVRAQQARVTAFQAKVDAARDRMPDFDQVFATTPISEAAADIIAESDRAAEIAYYLAKNPAEAQQIYGLPPHLQGREIARIEAKVSVPVRRTSAAPPPVPQVAAASAAPSAKDPANMTMAEYSEWRNAQLRRGA